MDQLLIIDGRLRIPASELRFRASRSGGPGGQHVNTSSTRIELLFDVARSPSLSAAQRELVLRALARRIDARGVLRIVAQNERSQAANRDRAVQRLVALLARALRPRKARVRTRPTTASRTRRREQKSHRSSLKRHRNKLREGED